MSTRVRLHKLNLRRLTSLLSVLLVPIAPVSATTRQVRKVKAEVQSYKYFRTLISSDGELVVFIGNGNQPPVISLTKGHNRITFNTANDGSQVWQLTKWTKQRTYHLFAKLRNQQRTKIGVLPVVNKLEFDSNGEACPETKDLISLIRKISLEDLSSKISSISTSDFIDEKSCKVSPIILSRVAKLVVREMNPSESFLMKCFNNEQAISEISKDESLRKFTTQILNSYSQRANALTTRNEMLKFGCYDQSEAPNARAVYNPQEQSIRLPVSSGNFADNKCKTVPQLITHELFHVATMKDSVATTFDGICARALKIPAAEAEECKKEYETPKDTCETGCKSGISSLAANEVAQSIDQKQQEALQPLLQNAVQASDFHPPDSSAVAEIAKPSSPENLKTSMGSVFNDMSRSLTAMSAPLDTALKNLNNAVGASVSMANASSSGRSKRQPAAASDSNEWYTTEKITVDNFASKATTSVAAVKSTEESRSEEASTNLKPKNSQAMASNDSKPTAAARPTQSEASLASRNSGGSANVSLPGGSGGGGGNSAAGPSAPTQSKTAAAATGNASSNRNAAKGNGQKREVASEKPNARSNNLESSQTKPKKIDPIVFQELKKFTVLRGAKYAEIKSNPELYDAQLATAGISLELRDGNTTRIIGAEREKAKIYWRDRGTYLQKESQAN